MKIIINHSSMVPIYEQHSRSSVRRAVIHPSVVRANQVALAVLLAGNNDLTRGFRLGDVHRHIGLGQRVF